MAFKLPPPPKSNDITSTSWQDWFYKLAIALGKTSEVTDQVATGGGQPLILGTGDPDGAAAEEGFNFPGRTGDKGETGERGPAGFAQDGEDGLDGIGIPGATGAAGPPGPAVFLEAEAAEEPMTIPGPAGPPGASSSIAVWVLPFAAAHG